MSKLIYKTDPNNNPYISNGTVALIKEEKLAVEAAEAGL